MQPSSHTILALINSISNKDYQFWTNYFLALDKKQTFLFLSRQFMTKKRKISKILHKLLGMLKSLKKAKKSQKTPFQATLGMLSMPKHAQVVRPCFKT